MMEFITALTQQSFLQTAVYAGLLSSLACGIMGTFVVVKRIGYLAGGIAHSVLAGMGAALFFGFSPLLGALIAALVAAILIGLIRLYWQTREDTLIGAIWALGMAIGVLFISNTPGYTTDLMSYLFGNILMVSQQNLWIMVALDLALLLTMLVFFRPLLAVAFDEEFASLRGLSVSFFYLLLLVLVSITVVLLIQVVGLILVIALLTIPAAIAGQFVYTLGRMMLLASVFGAVFTVAGLGVSYQLDQPSGAVIIMVAGIAYIIATLTSRQLKQRHSHKLKREAP